MIKSFITNFKQCFIVSFYLSLYIVAYFALANYSKKTPLDTAELEGLLAIAYTFSIIFLLFVVLTFFIKFAEIGIFKIIPSPKLDLTLIVFFLILTTYNLLVIENFSYTIFKFGLKTDNTIKLKFFYLFSSAILSIIILSILYSFLNFVSVKFVTIALLICGIFIIHHKYTAQNIFNTLSKYSNTKFSYKLPNIIILSADGLESMRLSVYNYERNNTPFLKSIKNELTLFENAFTNNGNTTGSITSLLTGRLPISTRVIYPPDILKREDSFLTLPRILRLMGYYCVNWAVPYYADSKTQNLISAFDEENGALSSSRYFDNLLPFKSGIEYWLINSLIDNWVGVLMDVMGRHELQNPYDQIVLGANTITDTDRLQGILKTIDQHKGPFFINSHFMGTHGPEFIPTSRRFSLNKKPEPAYDPDYYDDSIADIDAIIKNIYLKLQDKNILESTLLIITSDHGMLYETGKQIPLLIRFPNKTLTKDVKVNVQRIDIAPTLLDYIGGEIPSWMDGQSLLNSESIPANRPIISTKIIAPKTDSKMQLMYHDDNKVFGSNHETRVIICNKYFLYLFPLKLVQKGEVFNRNSSCSIKDDELENIANNELARRFSKELN